MHTNKRKTHNFFLHPRTRWRDTNTVRWEQNGTDFSGQTECQTFWWSWFFFTLPRAVLCLLCKCFHYDIRFVPIFFVFFFCLSGKKKQIFRASWHSCFSIPSTLTECNLSRETYCISLVQLKNGKLLPVSCFNICRANSVNELESAKSAKSALIVQAVHCISRTDSKLCFPCCSYAISCSFIIMGKFRTGFGLYNFNSKW